MTKIKLDRNEYLHKRKREVREYVDTYITNLGGVPANADIDYCIEFGSSDQQGFKKLPRALLAAYANKFRPK